MLWWQHKQGWDCGFVYFLWWRGGRRHRRKKSQNDSRAEYLLSQICSIRHIKLVAQIVWVYFRSYNQICVGQTFRGGGFTVFTRRTWFWCMWCRVGFVISASCRSGSLKDCARMRTLSSSYRSSLTSWPLASESTGAVAITWSKKLCQDSCKA